MKSHTRQIDGEYWFTAKKAAELLGTTRKTVEAMAVRELVRAIPDKLSFLIAESDVTRFRRDVQLLADAKKSAKMPPLPAKGETMSDRTLYKGNFPALIKKPAARIGNPLADEGHRSD